MTKMISDESLLMVKERKKYQKSKKRLKNKERKNDQRCAAEHFK